MTEVTEAQVKHALNAIPMSFVNANFGGLNAVQSIAITGSTIQLVLRLGFKADSQVNLLAMAISDALAQQGMANVSVHIETEVLASPGLIRPGQLAQVKNVVMVASGKGGVGKSTTAMNLALALRAEGAKVGILDADIYGPSLRTMLGLDASVKPELVEGKFVQPVVKYGIKSMSVAYLSEAKTPMIWRGPMAVKALQQLLEMTLWGELDYLIVDMPPGTGDIHISLAQQINVSAAVVVTTPQEMALIDARKGLEMFRKVNIPILGVVENMASHVCSNCGFEEAIFGCDGAQTLADQYEVRLLASIPLNKQLREHVDIGMPTVVKAPGSPLTRAYMALANNVGAELWQTNLSAAVMPTIQIVN